MCNECKSCENYSPQKEKWGKEDVKIILSVLNRRACIVDEKITCRECKFELGEDFAECLKDKIKIMLLKAQEK